MSGIDQRTSVREVFVRLRNPLRQRGNYALLVHTSRGILRLGRYGSCQEEAKRKSQPCRNSLAVRFAGVGGFPLLRKIARRGPIGEFTKKMVFGGDGRAGPREVTLDGALLGRGFGGAENGTRARWISRKCLITDEEFGSAALCWMCQLERHPGRVGPSCSKSAVVPVLGGFIGSGLGRGRRGRPIGAAIRDYTASIIGGRLVTRRDSDWTGTVTGVLGP